MSVENMAKQIVRRAGLLLAALFLVGPSGAGLFAAELDTIRIGDDYRVFNLPEGARYNRCARECRNDDRCRAWTFIRERVITKRGLQFNIGKNFNINLGGREKIKPAQCRLKHSVGPAADNECCVSGVVRKVRAEPRNRRERCANYAQAAINQQDKNLSRQCGYRGARWSGNYNRHYEWCLDSSRRARRNERQARRRALERCEDNRDRLDPVCERYAGTAVQILQSAERNDCRERFDGWRNEFDRIYRWCENTSRAQTCAAQ